MVTLDEINALARPAFVAALGGVFEQGASIAEQAFAARPFATVSALHEAMMGAVRAAPREAQLAFIRGHPELAGKIARAGAITDASKAEQESFGLDRLSEEEFARFERLNHAYRERFGFPFIICVRRHTRDSILAEFERRTFLDPAVELQAALAEIALIARLRLVAAVDGPGKPKTSGELTIHILDLVDGRPAAGIAVALYELGASATALIARAVTDATGETERPLLADAPLRIGTYELRVNAGSYFSARGAVLARPPFLDEIPVRFAIAEPEAHYHVPLRMTPWSYTTYRGA